MNNMIMRRASDRTHWAVCLSLGAALSWTPVRQLVDFGAQPAMGRRERAPPPRPGRLAVGPLMAFTFTRCREYLSHRNLS